MSFFKNLGEELGTGAGKGINTFFATCWKILCVFCSWLFKWEHKSNEGEFKTNSFRIATGSLILAVIFVPGLVTCSFKIPKIEDPSQESIKTVSLKVSLSKKSIPYFPKNNRFEINHEQGVQRYDDLGGIPFFSYHERNDGKRPVIRVDRKLCAVVPAGKEISFITNRPPVYVANMENELHYATKVEFLSFFKKNTAALFYLIGGRNAVVHTVDDWEYVFDNWGKVDSENYSIASVALPKKEILDNVAGGLVCF